MILELCDVFYNLKKSHILCLNQTHFNPQTSNITFFIVLEKYSSINIYYAWNDKMIIYDKFVTLSSHETSTILRVEFITTFNINERKTIHIIAI